MKIRTLLGSMIILATIYTFYLYTSSSNNHHQKCLLLAKNCLQSIRKCDSDQSKQCIIDFRDQITSYDQECSRHFGTQPFMERWQENYRDQMSYTSNTVHHQLSDDLEHLQDL